MPVCTKNIYIYIYIYIYTYIYIHIFIGEHSGYFGGLDFGRKTKTLHPQGYAHF